MSSSKIRTLIVDDSALYRLAVRNVLGKINACEVVGHAVGGRQALEKIAEIGPDLVTLDIEMPDVNGIEVLRAMKERGDRSKVIVLSKHTPAGAQVTMDALLEGAIDVVCKPDLGSPSENHDYLLRELEPRIEALNETSQKTTISLPKMDLQNHGQVWSCSAVVIGSSTGGPDVLRQVFSELPAGFPVPVIIVQHIPPIFSASFANRLDGVSALNVVEIEDQMPLETGYAYVAPGGQHAKLSSTNNRIFFQVTNDPPENNCRPAVDFTLRSACDALEGQVLAVILTGMGRDGLKGCQYLKKGGGQVIAQDASDCTVFGMPKAVIEAGLADQVATVPKLAKLLTRMTS